MEKMYRYTSGAIKGIFISLGSGVLISVIGMICSLCIERSVSLFVFFLFLAIVFISWIIRLARSGAFIPIYLSADGIKYREKTYAWTDVRIVAYPQPAGRGGVCYFLLVSDEYVFGIENIKDKRRELPYIKMTPNALDTLLPYYERKIVFLDSFGDRTDTIYSSVENNRIVTRHNAKYKWIDS